MPRNNTQSLIAPFHVRRRRGHQPGRALSSTPPQGGSGVPSLTPTNAAPPVPAQKG